MPRKNRLQLGFVTLFGVFFYFIGMKKAEKPYFVDNLSEELKAATSYVLVDFNGLSVKMQQDLKKRLRDIDARMVVVKNTLLKLASEKAKAPNEVSDSAVLSGPTALVITESDAVAPIQTIAKFAKEFEILTMKVGVIDGSLYDHESLIKLSTLPGKPALQAQVLGAICAPLYNLTSTLQGNLQKLIWVLDEAKNKKQ